MAYNLRKRDAKGVCRASEIPLKKVTTKISSPSKVIKRTKKTASPKKAGTTVQSSKQSNVGVGGEPKGEASDKVKPTRQTKSPTGFMDLPAELRNQVYIDTLDETLGSFNSHNITPVPVQTTRSGSFREPALLVTTLQIRSEARLIFYKNAVLRLAVRAMDFSHISAWLSWLGASTVAHIAGVQITLYKFTWKYANRILPLIRAMRDSGLSVRRVSIVQRGGGRLWVTGHLWLCDLLHFAEIARREDWSEAMLDHEVDMRLENRKEDILKLSLLSSSEIEGRLKKHGIMHSRTAGLISEFLA